MPFFFFLGKCPSLCPEPSLIENGDINAPEGARIHGGTSFYSCREGFILIGNSSRTCYNGSWLGKDPVCWSKLTDTGIPLYNTINLGALVLYVLLLTL